jgi:hypothetical protein
VGVSVRIQFVVFQMVVPRAVLYITSVGWHTFHYFCYLLLHHLSVTTLLLMFLATTPAGNDLDISECLML